MIPPGENNHPFMLEAKHPDVYFDLFYHLCNSKSGDKQCMNYVVHVINDQLPLIHLLPCVGLEILFMCYIVSTNKPK